MVPHPLRLAAAGNVEPFRKSEVSVELPRDLGILRLGRSSKNACVQTHTQYIYINSWLTLLRLQSRFGGQTTRKLTGFLSPKWDCGSRRVDFDSTTRDTRKEKKKKT